MFVSFAYSKLCLAQYACELISEGLNAVVVHPGVSGTGIFFGKDSGFLKWITAPGRRILDHFQDKGARASLVNVQAVCTEYRPYLYIHLRICGITGRPAITQMPEKFMENGIRKEAQIIIQQKLEGEEKHGYTAG